jgi:hypothetical protein
LAALHCCLFLTLQLRQLLLQVDLQICQQRSDVLPDDFVVPFQPLLDFQQGVLIAGYRYFVLHFSGFFFVRLLF